MNSKDDHELASTTSQVFSCSQPLPNEKISSEEFRGLLIQTVPEPNKNEVKKVMKNMFKIKGSRSNRNVKKKASRATVDRRRAQVIAYCKDMWKAANDIDLWRNSQDISIWGRKRSHSSSSDIESSCRDQYHPLRGSLDQRRQEPSDAVVEGTQYRTSTPRSSPQYELPQDFDFSDHERIQREQSWDDPNVQMLEEQMSQLVPEEVQLQTLIPGFVHTSSGKLLHELPMMKRPFPQSPKMIRQNFLPYSMALKDESPSLPTLLVHYRNRVDNLHEHLRALVQGGVPTEEDTEESIQKQYSLLDDLKDKLTMRSNQILHKSANAEDIIKRRENVVELTSAIVASGAVKSGNRLRTLNGIMGLVGARVFASDRIVMGRFAESMKWMEWSTKELYLNDQKINVAMVDNIRTTAAEYLNKTWRTIDTDCSETRRRLVLRLGVDRGGGTTKLALSYGNRLRGNNSPNNWLIVAVYDGKDDAKTLRGTVEEVFQEFDALKFSDLKLCPELNAHFETLEKLLIGDIPSVSAVLGVRGHSSRNPCFLCAASKDQLHEKAEKRDYCTCDSKVTAALESHAFTPLLRTVFPVVPLLHCFQGPASTIYCRMEQDVKKIIIAKELRLPRDKWFEDGLQVRTNREVKADLQVLNDCARRITKSQNNNIGCEWEEDCSSWCGQRRKGNLLNWLKCKCGRWFHSLCMGVVPSQIDVQRLAEKDQDAKTADGALTACPNCRPENMIPHFLERIRAAEIMLHQELRNITIVSRAKDTGLYLAWESTSRAHNILPGRFHGGLLNGNQARDFLRQSSDFLDAFSYAADVEDRILMYRNVLEPLNKLHQLTKAMYLTDAQLCELSVHQASLKKAVLEANWISFTPKFHLLCNHLSEVASKLGTIGIHSEQGLEHLHKLYTEEEANFLQKRQPHRAQATAFRINAKNIEVQTNPLTQRRFKLLEHVAAKELAPVKNVVSTREYSQYDDDDYETDDDYA